MSIARLMRPVLLLLALFLVGAAPTLAQQGYPHVGLYWSIHGDGRPLLDSTGTVDPTVAGNVSRYHELIVDVDPLAPYRPDVLLALRQRNPSLKIFGYVTGHYIWPSLAPDSLNHYPTRYWRMVRNNDGFLYNKSGAQFGLTNHAFANVNLAKNVAGHYVIAESLATLFWDVIVRPGNWDGVFIDTFCEGILWAQAGAESIDFARAGYASPAAFDAAWHAGTDTLASRLRALSGPTPILVGNCEPNTKWAWFNGWMRENFPYQGGGTWYANMYDDPGGYFTEDQRFRTPRNNFIFSGASPPTSPYVAENLRRARFGLASAALGDGYATFGYSARVTDVYPYWNWWYDEYAVDLASGQSTTLQRDTGWLGQPLTSVYQMIWAGTNPDAVPNPGAETDLGGWTFWYNTAEITATFARDTTTAAAGRASFKISVPNATSVDWYVNIASNGSIPVSPGSVYSATFWARASVARTITVVAGNSGASRRVDIGTTWKQYQVALVPLWSSASSNLAFFVGLGAGDVWIDDAHLQQGATTLFRRDFQNGTVLVNPSNVNLTVPLGSGYRSILGQRDLVTNNGAPATSVTVNGGDARFLISTGDVVAPASITDLRFWP